MSERGDYTDDEWFTLWRAVATVPTAVMVAHPAHLVREALAADRAFDDMAEQCTGIVRLLVEPGKADKAWLSHRLDLQRRRWGAISPDQFMNETLEDCRRATTLLSERGTPEEIAEYQKALFYVALHVARAGKEGEFFGFGGVVLDESEKVFLRDLAEVLQIEWSEGR
jgi:hypothetical protein